LQEFWDRLIFGRNFGVPYFGIARISPKTWVSVNQDWRTHRDRRWRADSAYRPKRETIGV